MIRAPYSDAEQRSTFRALDAETARLLFESQVEANNAQPWMAAELATLERDALRRQKRIPSR